MITDEWLEKNTIHKILGGSRLYGTSTVFSDYDYRGVCLMPKETLLGLDNFEQYESNINNKDVIIYGINKFIRLAIHANPNILDILFATPERWLVSSFTWEYIYNHRRLFLTQEIRKTFSGYAHSELQRASRHHRWLTVPPVKPDYQDYHGTLVRLPNGTQEVMFISHADKDNYDVALSDWNNYQTWLINRNENRLTNEMKVGYNVKNAAHLVRLLLKCEMILDVCDYDPVLSGKHLDMVTEVLQCNWSYERLLDFAKRQQLIINNMTSYLPHKINYETINDLVMYLNYYTLIKNNIRND